MRKTPIIAGLGMIAVILAFNMNFAERWFENLPAAQCETVSEDLVLLSFEGDLDPVVFNSTDIISGIVPSVFGLGIGKMNGCNIASFAPRENRKMVTLPLVTGSLSVRKWIRAALIHFSIIQL